MLAAAVAVLCAVQLYYQAYPGRSTTAFEQWVPDVEAANVAGVRSAISAVLSTGRGRRATAPKRIVIIGERNSGTEWLGRVLEDAFDVPVVPRLCTFKHWFQHRVRDRVFDSPGRCAAPCRACTRGGSGTLNNTLVVAIVRNPYDWLLSLHHDHWHAPSHGDLSFDQFVRRVWAPAARFVSAAAAFRTEPRGRGPSDCIDNFVEGEVLPCVSDKRIGRYLEAVRKPRGLMPVYEMADDGRPFKNVLALRTAKLRDFRAVATWAPRMEPVLHDALVAHPLAVARWLQSIESKYGLRRRRRVRNVHDLKGGSNGRYRARTSVDNLFGRPTDKQLDYLDTFKRHSFFSGHGTGRIKAGTLEFINGVLDADVEAAWGIGLVGGNSSGAVPRRSPRWAKETVPVPPTEEPRPRGWALDGGGRPF